MLSVIRPQKTQKKRERVFRIAKKTGLMNITKAFHEGLSLSWGGAYGDLMHYDARNLAGDPKKIHEAVKAFAKDKTLHKELADIWGPLRSSDESARLEELLRRYPKP